jgi:hypothetical protein
VQRKTKTKPFVMLIDSKQVIHTSSPELSPLKLLGFPLTHKLHLKCSKVQNDHIPVIAG